MAGKKNILDKLAEEVDKIEISGKKKELGGKQTAARASGKVKSDKRKNGKAKKSSPKKSLPRRQAGKKAKNELSMEELLKENPVEIPKIGDVLEGKVIEISSNYILLDLGPLGTGIVLGKEMKDGLNIDGKIKEGDTVRIFSPFGSCLMKAQISDRFAPDVIHCDFGWWFPEKKGDAPELFGVMQSNVNALLPSGLQGPGGLGYPFRCFICNIEKAKNR